MAFIQPILCKHHFSQLSSDQICEQITQVLWYVQKQGILYYCWGEISTQQLFCNHQFPVFEIRGYTNFFFYTFLETITILVLTYVNYIDSIRCEQKQEIFGLGWKSIVIKNYVRIKDSKQHLARKRWGNKTLGKIQKE